MSKHWLEQAHQKQHAAGLSLLQAYAELHALPDLITALPRLAEEFGLGHVADTELPFIHWLDDHVAGGRLGQYQGQTRILLCDPTNPATLRWAAVRQARYGQPLLVSQIVQGMLPQSAPPTAVHPASSGTSPAITILDNALAEALRDGASDLHLETRSSGLVIKLRLDGVLIELSKHDGTPVAEQVISRLKVLAELDIAERRVPQDGRFRAAPLGRAIDFRVSIMPSIHGEDAVIRVLDKRALETGSQGLTLASLGFSEDVVTAVREAARLPHGMLLVTGPTGSGKTTTLYAAINEVYTGLDKIITIEDPIEYELDGVLQIPVNEKKGLTFARGLRSILRHDPDTILVGEIRDPETAEISIQSALTGHLVYTTVHANNAFDVLARFFHMGVDPYSFVSAVNTVLAQRLLRINCSQCRETVALDQQQQHRLGTKIASMQRGRGCAACRHTGYAGRKAIGEVLVLNDDIREHILARGSVSQLKRLAQQAGTRPMRDAALDLLHAGWTTAEEVLRVTAQG